jgi:hypothetical protein
MDSQQVFTSRLVELPSLSNSKSLKKLEFQSSPYKIHERKSIKVYRDCVRVNRALLLEGFPTNRQTNATHVTSHNINRSIIAYTVVDSDGHMFADAEEGEDPWDVPMGVTFRQLSVKHQATCRQEK